MTPGQRAFEFLRQLRGDVKRRYTLSMIKRLQERESREWYRKHGPIRKIEPLNPKPNPTGGSHGEIRRSTRARSQDGSHTRRF